MANQDVDVEIAFPEPVTGAEDWYESRESDLSAQHGEKGTIIVLHGYDPSDNHPSTDPWAMLHGLVARFQNHFGPRGYGVLRPHYDTTQKFPYGAQQTADFLHGSGANLSNNVHIFGYSMGGIVARQLVANGVISPKSLVTYCSPHQGTGWWIPTPGWPIKNGGAISLEPQSWELNDLRNNARDQQFRDRYHFIGVGYYELGKTDKWHDNDQLIECASHLATGAGPMPASQVKWAFHRHVPVSPFGKVHSNCQLDPMASHAFEFHRGVIENLDG